MNMRHVQPVSESFQVAHSPRWPRRRARRSFPCQTGRVDPLVYAVALDMADGDPRRVRILSADTVLVTNRPRGGTP